MAQRIGIQRETYLAVDLKTEEIPSLEVVILQIFVFTSWTLAIVTVHQVQSKAISA